MLVPLFGQFIGYVYKQTQIVNNSQYQQKFQTYEQICSAYDSLIEQNAQAKLELEQILRYINSQLAFNSLSIQEYK